MMTPIENVTIVGPGAMGAIYASILYDLDPGCVRFVADGDRYDRLCHEGVLVNGKQYAIAVVHSRAKVRPSDLVLFAVKNYHLDDAIRDAECTIGDSTDIMSVMNGIESEDRLAAVFGAHKVVYAVAVGIDAVRVGNRVSYTDTGKILFGEARNPSPSKRIKRIQELFDRAGIPWETPLDMIRTIWWKFMINVGINQASAALRAPYSVFQTSKDARRLMESAIEEVISLAGREGVLLSANDVETWYTVLSNLNPQGKTSMLQDVEAGRKTEVDAFAGKVIALGRRHAVPTPVNQRLFDRIKEIEASGQSVMLEAEF